MDKREAKYTGVNFRGYTYMLCLSATDAAGSLACVGTSHWRLPEHRPECDVGRGQFFSSCYSCTVPGPKATSQTDCSPVSLANLTVLWLMTEVLQRPAVNAFLCEGGRGSFPVFGYCSGTWQFVTGFSRFTPPCVRLEWRTECSDVKEQGSAHLLIPVVFSLRPTWAPRVPVWRKQTLQIQVWKRVKQNPVVLSEGVSVSDRQLPVSLAGYA